MEKKGNKGKGKVKNINTPRIWFLCKSVEFYFWIQGILLHNKVSSRTRADARGVASVDTVPLDEKEVILCLVIW